MNMVSPYFLATQCAHEVKRVPPPGAVLGRVNQGPGPKGINGYEPKKEAKYDLITVCVPGCVPT